MGSGASVEPIWSLSFPYSHSGERRSNRRRSSFPWRGRNHTSYARDCRKITRPISPRVIELFCIPTLTLNSFNIFPVSTCFYVLGLISSTSQGAEILDDYHWEATISPLGLPTGLCIPVDLGKFISVSGIASIINIVHWRCSRYLLGIQRPFPMEAKHILSLRQSKLR